MSIWNRSQGFFFCLTRTGSWSGGIRIYPSIRSTLWKSCKEKMSFLFLVQKRKLAFVRKYQMSLLKGELTLKPSCWLKTAVYILLPSLAVRLKLMAALWLAALGLICLKNGISKKKLWKRKRRRRSAPWQEELPMISITSLPGL